MIIHLFNFVYFFILRLVFIGCYVRSADVKSPLNYWARCTSWSGNVAFYVVLRFRVLLYYMLFRSLFILNFGFFFNCILWLLVYEFLIWLYLFKIFQNFFVVNLNVIFYISFSLWNFINCTIFGTFLTFPNHKNRFTTIFTNFLIKLLRTRSNQVFEKCVINNGFKLLIIFTWAIIILRNIINTSSILINSFIKFILNKTIFTAKWLF